MLYFKNPPKKKGKGGRKTKKRRTAAQKRATAKLVRMNKAKAKGRKRTTAKRSPTKRKSRRKTTVKSTKKKGVRKVAARKRGRRKARKRTVRRHTYTQLSGKIFRGNPPIVKRVVQGVKDAAFVKVGGIAGTMISDMVPVTGMGKTAVKAGVAVLLGSLPVPGDSKRFVVAGAMSGVLDDLLILAGLSKFAGSGVSAYLPSDGGVSAYLSGTDEAYVNDPAVGAYVDY